MAPMQQMLPIWVHMLQDRNLSEEQCHSAFRSQSKDSLFTKGPLNCLEMSPSFAQPLPCMAIPHRSVGEWLRNIDEDLEVYRGEFEELGYNLKFMIATVTCLHNSCIMSCDEIHFLKFPSKIRTLKISNRT
jgi:hypothetical protein